MSKFDNAVKQRLVELVQERPCLWNKLHPSYKDSRRIKQNNWEDIQMVLQEITDSEITVAEVSRNWTNLKDTFSSNRRKYESALASGVGASEEPTWQLWRSMKFLLKNSSGNESKSNLTSSPRRTPRPSSMPTRDNSIQDNSIQDDSTQDNSTQDRLNQNESCNSGNEITPAKRRKRQPKPNFTKGQIIDNQICETNKPSDDNAKEDEFTCFGRTLGHRLRRMTAYQSALARKRIEDILFDVEFSTPQINPHPSTQPAPQQSQSPRFVKHVITKKPTT